MNPQLAIAITGKNAAKPAFDSVVADANRVAGALGSAGGRAAVTMDSAGFATANLAAQFNDIGVMLASGQSPLLLAIQQGTQISQVLGPMKAGAAVAALKTALLSLLSPVTLITIGSIAAGAAVVQWLMSAKEEAENATDAIERHEKAVLASVKGYKAAEEAVTAFFAAAGQMPREIAASQINAQFAAIEREMDALRDRATKLGAAFVDVGSTAERSFSALASEFARGEISAEDLYLGLQDVRGEMNALDQLPFGLSKYIDELEQGALKAIAFGDALNNLVAQTHALAGVSVDPLLEDFFDDNSVESAIESLKRLTPELRTQQEIIQDTYSTALANPALTDAAREQLALAKEEALAAVATAEARRAASRASGQAQKEADREREAVVALIGELEHEKNLIGLSNVDKEVQNALRRAGAAATDAERAQIEELIRATYDQEQAQKAVVEQWEKMGRVGDTVMRGIVDAISDGKIEAGEFDGILKSLTASLLNMGLSALQSGLSGGNNPFSFLFGGGPRYASSITGSSGGFFPGLTGPSLPSFSGGGDTGMAPRAGGLDGQGGFLAMMHPQERVIDLAQGSEGGMGSGVSVVRIELGEGLEGQILTKAAGQTIQIVGSAAGGISENGANQAGKKLAEGDFGRGMASYGLRQQAKRR